MDARGTKKRNRDNRNWVSYCLPLKVVFACSYIFYSWARNGDVGDTALSPILTKASQQEVIVDVTPGVKRYERTVQTSDLSGGVTDA